MSAAGRAGALGHRASEGDESQVVRILFLVKLAGFEDFKRERIQYEQGERMKPLTRGVTVGKFLHLA